MRIKLVEIEGKKRRLSFTKILRATKEKVTQPTIPYSEQDRKLSIASINEYLESDNSEESNIIKD